MTLETSAACPSWSGTRGYTPLRKQKVVDTAAEADKSEQKWR